MDGSGECDNVSEVMPQCTQMVVQSPRSVGSGSGDWETGHLELTGCGHGGGCPDY